MKLTQPRYQEVPSARLPTAQTADGLASVTVVAGEALGVHAVIETHTPIVYQDWTFRAGADVTVPVDAAMNAMVYVFEGGAQVGARAVDDGQLAILGPGDEVTLRSASGGRLLLLAGVPHREPVARYGPFVMNHEHELEEAFRDYQSGRMGEITRTARVG